MTGIFTGTLPGDMGFEVRREKQPGVCEMNRSFAVWLLSRKLLCGYFLLSLPYWSPLCCPSLLLGLPQSLP